MDKSILIKPLKTKKAQAWSLDIVIATVIFLTGIIVLYVYAINYLGQSDDQLEQLFYEGNLASELILSEEDFGIIFDNQVNQTKLNEYNLNYPEKKNLLGVTSNFYFTLDDVNYFGSVNTTSVEDLIQITRITVYNYKPTKFQLFIWK